MTTRINAWKKSNPILSVSVESDDREGLSEQEIKLIESTLALQETPDEYVSTWGIKEEMKRRGFNEVAFNIAVRKLLVKNFVETSVEHDYNGNECNVLTITSLGNDWILKNEDKFSFVFS